jgi:hypothetical protein
MTGAEGEQLSPHVAELLERVNAKVASTATLDQIRELAEEARLAARDNSLTAAEIGQLVAVATASARKVELLVARLAELSSEARHGT